MGTSADPGEAPGRTPYLPEPTGPYPVGTTSLWLTDTSRPDPWAAGVSARELMVTVWYPATSTGGRRAQYMTPAESELQLTSRGINGVPPEALSTVRTNAAVDAAPDGRQRSLPLVVLSPGFTNSRSTLTALAEDLASHGYVVAGIDHTYESYGTAFPDGRVTTCLAREEPRRDRGEKVVAGRAADVSFVLDELTGAHPAWPGAALIDPSRMAMAGHSMGGAAAIAAMLADSRIRAGIDMDGATHAPIPDEGLPRPFLFLGKESNYTPGKKPPGILGKLKPGPASTWERDWRLLTGWKRWLLVAGAIHASFTDLALLADQVGLDTGTGITGARSLDITRAYVRAFFDQHLRGRPQALLDQPSPRYPEVTFCSPDVDLGDNADRMSKKTPWIFVDCEARGTSPVHGVLTEFGAVHYDTRDTFHGRLFDATPDPDNPAISIVGERVATDKEVAESFTAWLHEHLGNGRPVFVSDNPAYDWQWIAGMFDRAGMDNPFGHSGRRISDFWAGLNRNWSDTQGWKRFRRTAHDHNPVNDAMGNVEAFEEILRLARGSRLWQE